MEKTTQETDKITDILKILDGLTYSDAVHLIEIVKTKITWGAVFTFTLAE